MTSNSASNPGGVAKAPCLSLMHEVQRYFQLLNHTFGSTANLNFSLVLFAIFCILRSPFIDSQKKKNRWCFKEKKCININVKIFFFKFQFYLSNFILFSCICGGVELNRLLIDYGASLMSGFFISCSKYMLLNAASECFLIIFVSTKE